MPPLKPSIGTATQGMSARRVATVLAVAVLVALLLRLPLLDRPVWFDEACMSHQRIGTWPQLCATLYVDIHPPLFVVFMYAWNHLFGDGELALRLPALLAGLLSIPLTFWTGHRLVGQHAALLAACLLALSPVHVWYSAEARLYLPMLLSVLLAIGTFDRLLDPAPGPRRALWLLHVANVLCLLGLHYYLVAMVTTLAVLAPLFARGRSQTAMRLVFWHGLGILLLGGYVLAKRGQGAFETSQDYLRALTPAGLFDFVFDWCWTGHTLAPTAAWNTTDPLPGGVAGEWLQRLASGLGTGLLLLGTIAVLRRARNTGRSLLVLVGLLTLPGFLLVLAALGFEQTYLERSLIAALPFVFRLAAAGATLPRGAAGRTLQIAALACVTTTLVGLYVFKDRCWTVYKPNSDWRAVATWLGGEIDRGGAGRPVFTSTPNARPLAYYDARIQDVKSLQQDLDPAQLGKKVAKLGGGWLGAYAERTFRDFVAGNQELLAGAKLRVYRAKPELADLDLPHRLRDDVCYLVRDHWHPHPSVDDSIERLLQNPRVETIECFQFTGITVTKVRIRP